MVDNKRGQQMTLGTIIAIVLGIAVLVFLIFGFSSGWNNLWDRVTEFGGGDNNVDTIEKACALACSTNGKSAFCSQVRTVKYGASVNAWNGTGRSSVRSSSGACKVMINNNTNYPQLNVAPCSAITC